MGRDFGDYLILHFSHHRRGVARDEGKGMGPDYQHRIDAQSGRQPLQIGL